MTIPVNKLKVMAFSFGAAIGALGGALFAAQQGSVFPTNFTESILILIYACLVLGGAGSIAGAIAGGIIVWALEQMLSSPTDAGYLFYGLILLALFLRIRPLWKFFGGARRDRRVRLRRARDRRRDLEFGHRRPAGQLGLDRLRGQALGDRPERPGQLRQHPVRPGDRSRPSC